MTKSGQTILLIINYNIMLETNHLYRRIQNKNLFRTFSRTYSRQTPVRKIRSENRDKTICQNTHSTPSVIQTQNTINLNPDKFKQLDNNNQRKQLAAQTAPLFLRTEQYSYIDTPLSNTLNFTSFNSKQENSLKYGSNPFLHSVIEHRKEKAELLSSIKLGNRKQNFKLKSCFRKEVNYDSDFDQTDFSILEFNRRRQLKKNSVQGFEVDKVDLSRINKVTDYKNDLRMQAGKRIAPHLFAKYTRALQELNKKKPSISNSIEK